MNKREGRSPDARDRVVLILGATAAPGPALASALAHRGARLVVVDHNGPALTQLARQCGGRIEPLVLPDDETQTMRMLGEVWAGEPLDMVVNLSPLMPDPAIDEQIACLSRLVHSTARGLRAGKGCFVSVLARPADPLRLQATALHAGLEAASSALGHALARGGVRVHSLSVPRAAPERAKSLLIHLAQHRLDDLPATAFAL